MFKYAIVRKPGKNFADGITRADLGKPDYKKTVEQHNAYCEALKKCGLELIILEPEIRLPDGVFVEDTAVVTEECAVILRPSTASRRGEEEKVREVLSKFRKIETIEPPGNVDGGDVLRVGCNFFIGISKRTNREGAEQLGKILDGYNYITTLLPVKEVLHLKTGITYIGNNSLVSIEEFAGRIEFSDFNIVRVDDDETYSANCLLVNDTLLIPKGFLSTKENVSKLNQKILEINTSEFQKMDGGLTCLSILF